MSESEMYSGLELLMYSSYGDECVAGYQEGKPNGLSWISIMTD